MNGRVLNADVDRMMAVCLTGILKINSAVDSADMPSFADLVGLTDLVNRRPYYTVSQKNWTISLEHNFRKCCPILIILSLLQTEIICPQTDN